MNVAFDGVKPSWVQLIKSLEHYNSTFEPLIIALPIDVRKNIFQPFKYFEVDEIKCIIVGQDRYREYSIPNGLAFGVNEAFRGPIPPSLLKIIECLKHHKLANSIDTTLVSWAKQGVLLLNAFLTAKTDLYWRVFFHELFVEVNKHPISPVVFLWGNDAKSLALDFNKSWKILTFGHPSPQNRANSNPSNQANFLYCPHFKEVSDINWGARL